MIKAPEGFSKGINDYLNLYILAADAKIFAILAAALVIAGILLSIKPNGTLPFAFNIFAVISLVSTVLTGIFVIYPRLPSQGDSVVFWEDIVRRKNLHEYRDDVKTIDEERAEQAYVTQNYYASQVLHRKYQYTRVCLILFVIGLVLGFVSLLL